MASRTLFSVVLLLLGAFTPFIACQSATTKSTATTRSTGTITSPSAPDRSAEGVQVCFGEGSICVANDGLSDQCQQEEDAHGHDGYWKCVCTSGYGAVDDACDNCQLFYGVISSKFFNYTSTCSSMGYTLAPIPSSILAQQSSHNATRGTGLPTSQKTTYVVTVKPTPTAPLPSIATTFSLPLATGAASHRTTHYGPLGGLSFVAILLGLW